MRRRKLGEKVPAAEGGSGRHVTKHASRAGSFPNSDSASSSLWTRSAVK